MSVQARQQFRRALTLCAAVLVVLVAALFSPAFVQAAQAQGAVDRAAVTPHTIIHGTGTLRMFAQRTSPNAIAPGRCPPAWSSSIAFFVDGGTGLEVFCYQGHGTSNIAVPFVDAFQTGPGTVGQFMYDPNGGFNCTARDNFGSNVDVSFAFQITVCGGWSM
jgi:hypothetical protein